MSQPLTPARPRHDWVLVGLSGLWLLGWRLVLDTPWGFDPVPTSGGLVNVGIAYNAGDTWSYLSWVQQYYHGANLAGLNYTTEPHAPLLWLFPLWLIGKTAAVTGLSVLGTYNAAGVVGTMAAVYCLLRVATALGLPVSARHWTAVAFLLGSGGSWLWHAAHKLGLAPPAHGGDLFFLDLFPSTALIAYAYHAVGLALLAALWWTITELESRRLGGQPAARWLAATAVLALLLGFSRPYEPVAFLGAWGLKTAWHWIRRKQQPTAWRSSLACGVLLGLCLFPGIGWALWVSTQPVWSTFARESLALGLDRTAWLWTFAGWAGLVALGVGPALRADARRAVLPVAATVLLGLILFGLGSAQAKLASGLILGPILLAGWGAARLVSVAHRLPAWLQVASGGLLLSGLLGIGSLFMNLNAMKLEGPALVDADLVALARRLPFDHTRPAPVVLTDAATGALLPGMTGARVWVGHWSLSGHYQAKVARLRLAGLDPQVRPLAPARTADALTGILSDAAFDYALLDRRCVAALAFLRGHEWQPVEQTPRWSLLRAPRYSP